MRKTANALLLVAVGALTLSSLAIVPAAADDGRVVVVSRPVDIRVWVQDAAYDDHDYRSYRHDHEYDVYRSADDLVLCVRAERNTYATVYVVDTDGFIHVVHPFSPHADAFLRGGRVYKFHMGDAGFSGPSFARGVAFAYAVSSPVPFRYNHYGWGVFGASYGFRIYGDPYIASRQFYLNLVAGSCDVRLIGVSHARFYIREYVRYPNYLCAGWHDYHGVHNYCRGDCFAFRNYRIHSTDPYRVLHPQREMKYKSGSYTQISRVAKRPVRDTRERVAVKEPVRQQHKVVVRSSKGSFVKSKNNVSKMREQLKKRDAQRRHDEMARVSGAKSKRAVATRTTQVVAQKSKKDRADKVTKNSKKERTSDAKKSSKGKSASDDNKSSKKAEHGAR